MQNINFCLNPTSSLKLLIKINFNICGVIHIWCSSHSFCVSQLRDRCKGNK